MIEIMIISALVLWSCYIVFKKVFPSSFNAVLKSLSGFAQSKGWTKLATHLNPKTAAGCGGGCGCAVDETQQSTKTHEVKAVKWK